MGSIQVHSRQVVEQRHSCEHSFQYSQGSGRIHLLLQLLESLLFDSVRVSCFAKHRVFVTVHPFQPGIVRSDLTHLGNHEYVCQPLLEAVDWADLNEGRLNDAVMLTVNLSLRSARVNRVKFNELLRARILCCASSLYASPTPVVEYISPALPVKFASPAPTAFDAPAPVVEYFGPAPGRATLGLHLQGFPHQLQYGVHRYSASDQLPCASDQLPCASACSVPRQLRCARTHTVCRTRSNGEDLDPEKGVSYAAPALTAHAAPASVGITLQSGIRRSSASGELAVPTPTVYASCICCATSCDEVHLSSESDELCGASVCRGNTSLQLLWRMPHELERRKHRSSTNAYLRRVNAYSTFHTSYNGGAHRSSASGQSHRACASNGCSTNSSGEVHSSRASGGLRSTRACAV